MKAVAVFPKSREVRLLTDAPEPELHSPRKPGGTKHVITFG